jgi:5-methylcytosine-specific restriction endonuclease McrA
MSRSERRQVEIDDTKLAVAARDGWRCVYCGCVDQSRLQLAHRVPQDRRYIDRYGSRVIHHSLNMVLACDRCNHKAEVDPKTRPIEAQAIIVEILTAIKSEDV